MLKLLLIIFGIIVIVILWFKLSYRNMTYIKSDIDGQFYLVRNLADKRYVANILARMKYNILSLSNYLYEKRDEKEYKEFKPYIEQFNNRIKNVTILESTDDGIYTSYTVNKGEQIFLCVRSRKIKDKIHDVNLMMYVVLHEISHVACPEYDHTPLFKKIFAFLSNEAIKLNMYSKIDFFKHPEEYCGLVITDSII